MTNTTGDPKNWSRHADTEPDTRYSAGWNMPGYLPETDPEGFVDFADAVQYLVETVDRFWDSDTDVPELDEDGRWLPVHTALSCTGTTLPDEGTFTFAATCGDDHLTFWIEPA